MDKLLLCKNIDEFFKYKLSKILLSQFVGEEMSFRKQIIYRFTCYIDTPRGPEGGRVASVLGDDAAHKRD